MKAAATRKPEPVRRQDQRAEDDRTGRRAQARRGTFSRNRPLPADWRRTVTEAGHPLDPGLRRVLEAELGHDFSRVRIHTGPEANALAELLGAEAVTAGQEVFFAADAFAPHTAPGRLLLAQELLHSVQSPDLSGTLLAGRSAGAVSVPVEPVEVQAVDAAEQALGAPGADVGTEPDRGAEVERATAPVPGWLRYASVDPAQRRIEQLDPATVAARIVAGLLRILAADPMDRSRRVRHQLARLEPGLQQDVLARLEVRLPSSDLERVLEWTHEVEEEPTAGPPQGTTTPEPIDPVIEPGTGSRDDVTPGRTSEREPREAAEDRTRDAGTAPEETSGQRDKAGRDEDRKDTDEKDDKAQKDEKKAREKDDKGKDEKPEDDKDEDGKDEDGKDEDGKDKKAGEKKDRDRKQDGRSGDEAEADAARGAAEGAVGAGEAAGAAVEGPAGTDVPEVADATAREGATARAAEAVRALASQDRRQVLQPDDRALPEDRVPPGEEPEGHEPLDAPELDATEQPLPAPEEGLPPVAKPEDYLPAEDLDVSRVPTADTMELPTGGSAPAPPEAPSFPAPPRPAVVEGDPETDPLLADQQEEKQEAREGGIPLAPGQIPAEVGEAPEPDVAGPAAEPEAGPGAGSGAGPVAEPGGPHRPRPSVTEDQPGSEETGGPVAEVDDDGGGPAGVTPTGPGGSPGLAGPDGPQELPGTGQEGPVPPDGSLEPGGGDCCTAGPEPPGDAGKDAGPSPTGGGGAPPAAAGSDRKRQDPAPPDVSGMEPRAALRTAARLRPDQAQTTLNGGVRSAVDGRVGRDKADLAASPPTMKRPSGAPRALHGPPNVAAPGKYASEKVGKVAPGKRGTTPKVTGERTPSGGKPADQPKSPGFWDSVGSIWKKAAGWAKDQVTHAFTSLTTSDPELRKAKLGRAEKVPLRDDTDPALNDRQQDKFKTRLKGLRRSGGKDADAPMGEDQIYPDVPPERLDGKVPKADGRGRRAGKRTAGVRGAGKGSVPSFALGLIAAKERGDAIRGATDQGTADMVTAEKEQATGAKEARSAHHRKVDAAVRENARQQSKARNGARLEVTGAREKWRGEQDAKVAELDGKAGDKVKRARTDIDTKAKTADKKVSEESDKHNEKIDTERTNAERDAEQKRKDGEKGSDSWWDRGLSWVKDQFQKVKDAISTVFDRAKKAVTNIIDEYKKLAFSIIDLARDGIITIINGAADFLIGLGDIALAFFPDLRDKWRTFINDKRDQAINKVNEFADKLKATVSTLLDAFAADLVALLDLGEKGMLAAVDVVEKGVESGINFAKQVAATAGKFAALIADIAPDPKGWLGKLGSAAKTGVRSYLWDALKKAVRTWFDQKVESMLGLGKLIFNTLTKGCFSIAKIGKMAWNAIIKALPGILIKLVIQKLISMIVPAAGAIMTIIQGLMAAWGSISRIIAAFNKFMAFLKAVSGGGATAAKLFAESVAAGAVALLDFLSNFLVSKLAKGLKGVATKLKGIAAKIMKALKRGAKSARKAAGRAVNAVKKGAKAAGKAITSGAKKVGKGIRRVGGAVAKGAKRVASAVGRGIKKAKKTLGKLTKRLAKTKAGKFVRKVINKVKQKYRKFKKKIADWRNKRKKRRQENKKKQPSIEQRLDRAVKRVRAKVDPLLARGVPQVALKALLAGLRLLYRLTSLTRQGGERFDIRAVLNPNRSWVAGRRLNRDKLLRCVREVAQEVYEKNNRPQDLKEIDAHGLGSEISVEEGAQSVTIANKLQSMNLKPGQEVIFRHSKTNAVSKVVNTVLGGPRNLLVYLMKAGKWSKHPPRYDEMKNLGSSSEYALFKKILGGVENNRSRSDVVFRAMASQIAESEGRDLGEVLSKLPLAPKGAQAAARLLNFRYEFQQRQKRPGETLDNESVRELVNMGQEEGLTPREISELTGASMDDWEKKKAEESGLPVEEFKATRQQRDREREYAEDAWRETKKVNNPKRANDMSLREVRFLRRWIRAVDLNFKNEDSQEKFLRKLKEEMRIALLGKQA